VREVNGLDWPYDVIMLGKSEDDKEPNQEQTISWILDDLAEAWPPPQSRHRQDSYDKQRR
jgi:hypothetical protein